MSDLMWHLFVVFRLMGDVLWVNYCHDVYNKNSHTTRNTFFMQRVHVIWYIVTLLTPVR